MDEGAAHLLPRRMTSKELLQF